MESFKITDYDISIDQNTIDKRIDEIAKGQQNFVEKKENEKSENGDMVVFDYKAKSDGKDFEGNEGKNIQIILGRDLFIKGFDEKLLGVKKNQNKLVEVTLPQNFPKKELANKIANFDCKIIDLKKPTEVKVNEEFAKKLGAKSVDDLKNLVKKQITNEYKSGLAAITKKDILEQIEKAHSLDLPPNLIEQETKLISQSQKKEDIEKNKTQNLNLAKSRIKTGLILNEIAEKNNLKVEESEIKNEIEKQIKSMPGQEKMVMEYYQKNPSAVSSLRGALYEEKIIELIKNKMKLNKKKVTLKEAEEILKNFSQKSKIPTNNSESKNKKKFKIKKKK